jgi:Ser/Thr protein kinase RdoA (MazF antagonist)
VGEESLHLCDAFGAGYEAFKDKCTQMMKLSTMQEVVATLNDQWESDLVDEILARWEHDAGRAKYWRASTNFVFFFKKLGHDCVLRFTHASERTVAAIQAEIDYVNFLAGQGLRVARPIRSTAGNDVESVVTEHGLFHAVVFEGLAGQQIDFDELTPDQCLRWGKALGELHNVSTHYSKVGRPTWEDHLAFVAEILPADETAAFHTLAELKLQLDQLAITELNFGHIHYDFELDNIIWDGEQPGIIDFDDSARYWFIADIALALGDLFVDGADNVNLQDETFLQFMRGYNDARPIDQDELKLIPLFLRLDNLVGFARLYRALTPINPTGEPVWLTELRGKLGTVMHTYRDRFSA